MLLVADTNAVLPSNTLHAIRNSSFKHTEIILRLIQLFSSNADRGRRAVYGIGLRPLTGWDCGFEFRRGMNICLI